jgi:hypothetical protein
MVDPTCKKTNLGSIIYGAHRQITLKSEIIRLKRVFLLQKKVDTHIARYDWKNRLIATERLGTMRTYFTLPPFEK